jgi:hypothetical protein
MAYTTKQQAQFRAAERLRIRAAALFEAARRGDATMVEALIACADYHEAMAAYCASCRSIRAQAHAERALQYRRRVTGR